MNPNNPQLNNPPTLPPVPPISQTELVELQRGRQAVNETDNLRKSILSRLHAGANVEAGPYSVRIKEVHSRRISRHSLEQLWGQEYVEQLRMNIPETVSTQLIISNDMEIDFFQ